MFLQLLPSCGSVWKNGDVIVCNKSADSIFHGQETDDSRLSLPIKSDQTTAFKNTVN